MEAKGVNGQVAVIGDIVSITRKGFMAVMTKGFSKGEKDSVLDCQHCRNPV